MRFAIISIILHTIVITYGYSLKKDKGFQIETIGTTPDMVNVSVNFNQNKTVIKKEEVPREKTEESSVEEIKEKIEEKIEKEIKEEIEIREEPVKKEIPPKKIITKKIQQKPIKQNNVSSKPANAPAPVNEGLIEISKGIFAAKNQGVKGLNYSFISNPDPSYPVLAKKMRYNKETAVRVKFLVGFDGKIEEIKFYNQDKDLGFKEEVRKALMQWQLTPVTVDGKKVKLYFYKEFKFNQK